MADRNRQRIGRIGARDLRAWEQHAQHRLHLFLRRAAGADDGLLDEARCIFADRQPGACAGEQRDAAGVRQLQRRLRIVVDEHFLDRRARRCMIGDHGGEHGVEMSEPVGQGRFRVGLYLPVGDMTDPAALDADDAPAGTTERGVETEDDQPSFSITASGIS